MDWDDHNLQVDVGSQKIRMLRPRSVSPEGQFREISLRTVLLVRSR